MIINHNMQALNAHRQMGTNATNAQKSMEKLSSGLRINRAGDDAAGLAISEKMRGQIRGLDQASRNAQDGISLIQTAEGALNETHSILQRMRELAVQSGNDTNTETDRKELQKEVDQLAKEMTRIASTTEFNTKTLLDGNLKDVKFQIGANKDQNLSVTIGAMDAFTLGVAGTSTTVNGTAAGNIGKVTFDKTQGTGVVDKANISFDYTAGTGVPTAATESSATAKGTFTQNTGFTAGGGDKLTITIGSDVIEITSTDLDKVVKAANADTAATELEQLLNGKGTVTNEGGKLKITSVATGADSTVAVAVTGTQAGDINSALGTTSGVDATAGKDATTGKDKITVSDGVSTQVVEIDDKTKTSFKIDQGTFAGLEINLTEGKTLADLKTATDKVTVSKEVVQSTTTEVAAGIDISTYEAANTAIETLNNAIETVSGERSKLGAIQNRLEHTINNLGTSSENLTAAESRVRDVDMAKEMMTMSKNNILQQAAQAMLAQANQNPQQVLQLLR